MPCRKRKHQVAEGGAVQEKQSRIRMARVKALCTQTPQALRRGISPGTEASHTSMFFTNKLPHPGFASCSTLALLQGHVKACHTTAKG